MNASSARPEWRADAMVIFIIVALGLFYTLWGAAHATDRAFAIQMWTGFTAFLVAHGNEGLVSTSTGAAAFGST